MSASIDFYFDFSSPYSYLASEKIEALAARHGRAVRFHPTLLGAVFRVSGQRPLTEIPLKGDYARRDFARSARHAGLPFRMPEVFPVSTVQAARACLALEPTQPTLLAPFIHAVFRAYFVEGLDITSAAVLEQLLERCGADAAAVMAAMAQPDIKERLKQAVDASIARGVFGAPFIIVDGEPFWGSDRLEQVERWLASGPF